MIQRADAQESPDRNRASERRDRREEEIEDAQRSSSSRELAAERSDFLQEEGVIDPADLPLLFDAGEETSSDQLVVAEAPVSSVADERAELHETRIHGDHAATRHASDRALPDDLRGLSNGLQRGRAADIAQLRQVAASEASATSVASPREGSEQRSVGADRAQASIRQAPSESSVRAALAEQARVAIGDTGKTAAPAAARAAEVDLAVRMEQATGGEGGNGRSERASDSSGPRTEGAAARSGEAAATVRGVERGLVTLASLRGGRMELTLDPADLGRVRIRMSMRGGAVRVDIVAERMQAAERLASRMQELRTGLERQGLAVERMTVQAAPESGSSGQTGDRSDSARESGTQTTRDENDERSRGRRDAESEARDRGEDGGTDDRWNDALQRMITGDDE